ncbi:MAG: shikimate dehydrogenase, partial [Pseudomonadota bacterium]
IEGVYEAVDASPEEFPDVVKRLADEGWQGVNVTIPHKTAAAQLADHRTEAVDAFGASNLLLFRDGKIIADNTDWQGFQRCLSALPDPAYSKAVVLGAGGAAAPIVHALLDYHDVVVVNRTAEKAKALASRFGDHVRTAPWEKRSDILAGAEVLVNTTSLGMAGQPPLDIDLEPMRSKSLVVDIVYDPLSTPLLKKAREKGFQTAHGLTMLVYQAVPSFRAFTGTEPPDPEIILRKLTEERQ